MGIKPITVARDVISTGRNRIRLASVTASFKGFPSRHKLREKSTIRMLFETTIPTIITSPISDMMFSVVPVNSNMNKHPRKSRWDGEKNDERIEKRLELRNQNQVNQDNRKQKPEPEALEGRAHALHGAAQIHVNPFRQLGLIDDFVDGTAQVAQVLALRGHIDIDHAP